MVAPQLVQEADRLVDAHFAAEIDGDLLTLLETFTDDVEHDVVGEAVIRHGKQQVADYYRTLLASLRLEAIKPVRRYHGDGFVVDESVVHARATREQSGAGHPRHLTFRLLHVFELRDGHISRENAWLDTTAIAAQLA